MNQWKFQVYAIPLLGWKSFTRLICVRKAPHCRPMIDSLSVLFIFRCIHTWQVELFCWESNYILETALGRKVASAFYPRIIYEKKFLNIKTVSMYIWIPDLHRSNHYDHDWLDQIGVWWNILLWSHYFGQADLSHDLHKSRVYININFLVINYAMNEYNKKI